LWFIFSFQPRSARSLLKLEQLTLCALGVLCGQNAFGGSTIIDSRYNTSSQKFSEIFLKPEPLKPMSNRDIVPQVWNRTPNE
jgi:hypothetical protein